MEKRDVFDSRYPCQYLKESTLLKECDKFYYAIQIENFSLIDLPPSLLHIVYVQLEMA
jgi:hypothetical protein